LEFLNLTVKRFGSGEDAHGHALLEQFGFLELSRVLRIGGIHEHGEHLPAPGTAEPVGFVRYFQGRDPVSEGKTAEVAGVGDHTALEDSVSPRREDDVVFSDGIYIPPHGMMECLYTYFQTCRQ